MIVKNPKTETLHLKPATGRWGKPGELRKAAPICGNVVWVSGQVQCGRTMRPAHRKKHQAKAAEKDPPKRSTGGATALAILPRGTQGLENLIFKAQGFGRNVEVRLLRGYVCMRFLCMCMCMYLCMCISLPTYMEVHRTHWFNALQLCMSPLTQPDSISKSGAIQPGKHLALFSTTTTSPTKPQMFTSKAVEEALNERCSRTERRYVMM